MPRKKDMKFKNKFCYNLNHLKVKQNRKEIIFKNNNIQLKTEYFFKVNLIKYFAQKQKVAKWKNFGLNSYELKKKKKKKKRTLGLWYLMLATRYICS